jgi:hypothetical protein
MSIKGVFCAEQQQLRARSLVHAPCLIFRDGGSSRTFQRLCDVPEKEERRKYRDLHTTPDAKLMYVSAIWRSLNVVNAKNAA